MIKNEQTEHEKQMESPQGHAMGFADTASQCENAVQALNAAGFPESSISVLKGEEGAERLRVMMQGSLWGESAEAFQRQGLNELEHGHCLLVVDVEDVEHANRVAQAATKVGAHSFYHFGLLEDVQLTK